MYDQQPIDAKNALTIWMKLNLFLSDGFDQIYFNIVHIHVLQSHYPDNFLLLRKQ